MEEIFGVPKDDTFRLAFPRGRFLQHFEDDLTVFVQLIDKCSNTNAENFALQFDREYQQWHKGTAKTIANHRTEMIALFGLTEIDALNLVKPSENTITLLRTQDFPLFFKSFCNKFQFPNCINSIDQTNKQIEAGIQQFKPAAYILNIFLEAEKIYPRGTFQVSGAEISNLVFNDIRVAHGSRSPKEVLDTIIEARQKKLSFPGDSNHAQHGREFLGYMTLANLLKADEVGRYYSLNTSENEAINYIIKNKISVIFPKEFLSDTDIRKKVIAEWSGKSKKIWREEEDIFLTKTGKYDYLTQEATLSTAPGVEAKAQDITAKPAGGGLLEIGNAGELIVLKMEKDIIGKVRPDKLPLVVRVANDTSLGYDIQSLEPDDCSIKKFIEVKTTVRTFLPSEEILTFFPMSANEWETARNFKESYYIYRVMLVSDKANIYVVKNPVQKELEGKIILESKEYRVILKHTAIDNVYLVER
jgi:hypothetical protein